MTHRWKVILATVVVVTGFAQTKQGTTSSPQMSMGVLAVTSDREGTLFVDGERKLATSPDKIVTLRLTAGQHFVDLRDPKGAKLWSKVVNVPAGAQVAEIITISGGVTSVPGSTSSPKVDLTQCEESQLLTRFQEALTACKKDDEALRSRYPEDLRESVDTKMVKRAVDDASKQFSELCTKSTQGCAELLYNLGDYSTALAEASPVIEAFKQMFDEEKAVLDKGGVSRFFYLDGSKTSAGNVSSAYALRGLIKYALSDSKGALADLRSSIDYLTLWKQEFNGRGLVPLDRAKPYLYSATVLYRIGRYEDAMADFNEYVALDKLIRKQNAYAGLYGKEKTLGDLIRDRLKNPGPAVTNSTSAVVYSSLSEEVEDAERSGRTAPLPTHSPCQSDKLLAGGVARYEVKNSTAYALRVILSGPAEREIRMTPNSSQTVTFPAGSYRVLGKVASPGVLPFYGRETFMAGTGCASEFYIQRNP